MIASNSSSLRAKRSTRHNVLTLDQQMAVTWSFGGMKMMEITSRRSSFWLIDMEDADFLGTKVPQCPNQSRSALSDIILNSNMNNIIAHGHEFRHWCPFSSSLCSVFFFSPLESENRETKKHLAERKQQWLVVTLNVLLVDHVWFLKVDTVKSTGGS